MERISTSLAVLGTGNVGRTLAAGFAAAGHQVVVGGREPDRPELVAWSDETGVGVTTVAEAAAGADVIVLATSWDGAENALRLAAGSAGGDEAGHDKLAGKIVLDVTNPLVFTDRLELALGYDDSGGEQVQRWAPTAKVVKIFNTVGYELMVNPELAAGPATMFVAGDDAEAKEAAVLLANDLGWACHDCGDIKAARLTEPVAMLWIEHAMKTGVRSHYFHLAAA
jgi:predicted dinucleotide-binding enzyme